MANSRPYVVQIGDVGTGKSTIVERLTREEGRSSAANKSVTLETEIFESYDGSLIICDTPGTNAMEDQFEHNLQIAHAMNFLLVNCVLIVVKAEQRMDNVIKIVREYLERFLPEDLPSQIISIGVTHMDVVSWSEHELLVRLRKLEVDSAIFISPKKSPADLLKELHNECAKKQPVKLSIDGDMFLRLFKINDDNIKVLLESQTEISRFQKMVKDFHEMKKSFSDKDTMDLLFEFQAWLSDQITEAQKTVSRKNNFEFYGPRMAYEYGHIAIMTNKLRVLISGIRIEASKYHKDMDPSFRKCPYCGEVWQKVEGCDGTTECGNRPSDPRDIERNRNGKMLTFQFKWNSQMQKLDMIKELFVARNSSGPATKQNSTGIGCGRSIKWKEMTPVTVPEALFANTGSTRDIRPLPPVIIDSWDDRFNTKYSLLRKLSINSCRNNYNSQTSCEGEVKLTFEMPVKEKVGDCKKGQRMIDQPDPEVEEVLKVMRSTKSLIDLPFVQDYGQDEAIIDTPKFEMTRTRGRALIISNRYEYTNVEGKTVWRQGSQHDHTNIMLMLERCGFVVTGEHKNYSAQEIIEAIHRETQLINTGTGRSVHEELGVFMLVVTSHGSKGKIAGSDGKVIELSEMYKLLSPRNFPAMKGKPKVIFIQACNGGYRDTMMDAPTFADGDAPPSATDKNVDRPTTPEADHCTEESEIANLFIMQPSFDSYLSFRNADFGSFFIRAIVATFYTQGYKDDIESLAKIIRCAVNKYTVELTEELKKQGATKDQSEYVCMMPVHICTFTDRKKKLYFQPGFEMCKPGKHPRSITDAAFEPTTKILWLDGNKGTPTLSWKLVGI